VLISRIIESKFPNYQAVIPRDNPNILTVDKEALIRAIKRVAILSSEKSRGIKFDLSGDELRLFSSNPEFGEARDKLTVDTEERIWRLVSILSISWILWKRSDATGLFLK